MRRLICTVFGVVLFWIVGAVPASTAAAACTGPNIDFTASPVAVAALAGTVSAFDSKCSATSEQLASKEPPSGQSVFATWWAGHDLGAYEGFGTSDAFLATFDPPNSQQESEILEKGGGEVLTIPIAQAAVALLVHLPKGCTAKSGTGKKAIDRLALSDAQLEELFSGEITTWSELAAAGVHLHDALVGEKCDSEAAIVPVVPDEASDLSHIVKGFLNEISGGALASEDGASHTWGELSEPSLNEVWPTAAHVRHATAPGAGTAAEVASTTGSVGFASLNEARADSAFTPAGEGGEGSAIFWAKLQSKGNNTADPSTDGETNAAANANCAKDEYLDRGGKLPSPEGTWNEVVAGTAQKHYPLCGLGYVVSLTKYSAFSEKGRETSEGEVGTAKGYFEAAFKSKVLAQFHDFLNPEWPRPKEPLVEGGIASVPVKY